MKSCKVIHQKKLLYKFSLELCACALQTHLKAHCTVVETGQTEVLMKKQTF